jgi:hypothetical protein
MNKIKIVSGIKASYEIEEDIKPDTDYLITFKVAREGVAQKDPHGEGTEPLKFLMIAESIEKLEEIGEHHKEIKLGELYSESAKTRFSINDALVACGMDIEEKSYEEIQGLLRRVFNNCSALKENPIEILKKMVAWLEAKKL